jgi:hypothetical protein
VRYSIMRCLLSFEATVEWLRRKAMHFFMHKLRNTNLSTRSLLKLIDTR